jgi:hypothetical protein
MSLLAPSDVLSSIARNGAIQAAFVASLYVSNERPILQAIEKIRHKILGGAPREVQDSKWKWAEYAVIALPLFYMGLHCRAKPVTVADALLLSIPKILPAIYSVYRVIKRAEEPQFYIAHVFSICTSIACANEAIVWKSEVERLRALFQEASKMPDFSLSEFVNKHLYPLELPKAKPMRWYTSWLRLKNTSAHHITEYKDMVSLYNLAGSPRDSKEVSDYIQKMASEFRKYFKDVQIINSKFSQRCERAVAEFRSIKNWLLDSDLPLKGIGMGSNRYEAAVRARDAAILKAKGLFRQALDGIDASFRELLKQS